MIPSSSSSDDAAALSRVRERLTEQQLFSAASPSRAHEERGSAATVLSSVLCSRLTRREPTGLTSCATNLANSRVCEQIVDWKARRKTQRDSHRVVLRAALGGLFCVCAFSCVGWTRSPRR